MNKFYNTKLWLIHKLFEFRDISWYLKDIFPSNEDFKWCKWLKTGGNWNHCCKVPSSIIKGKVDGSEDSALRQTLKSLSLNEVLGILNVVITKLLWCRKSEEVRKRDRNSQIFIRSFTKKFSRLVEVPTSERCHVLLGSQCSRCLVPRRVFLSRRLGGELVRLVLDSEKEKLKTKWREKEKERSNFSHFKIIFIEW